jgi:hypothetical protein
MKDCEVEMAALATQMECENVYCMSGELATAADWDRANVGAGRYPRTVKVGRTMAQLSLAWEVFADVRGLRHIVAPHPTEFVQLFFRNN